MFNAELPITNSGVLAIYGSDVLALPVILWIAWIVWVKRKALPRSLKFFAVIYLGFFAYCFSVFVYRYASGVLDMQSLVIPRATLVSSLVLILIVLGVFSARELITAAYVFATTLALVAVPLAMYDLYLPFSIFENLAIRADLQLFLMPLLLVGVLKRGSFGFGRIVHWLFALDLASLVFCSAVSGARVNAILVPVMIGAAIAAMLLSSEPKKALRIGLSVMLPVAMVSLMLVAVAPQNPRILYGLERNILYSAVSDLFVPSESASPTEVPPGTGLIEPDESLLSPPEPSSDGTLEDEAEQSANTSSSIRTEVWPKAWDDFSGNIWFGTGLKQYEVTYVLDVTYTSVIQPHNFVLEYLMAYGISGFLLFLLLFFYWPLVSITAARRKGKNILLGLFMFSLSIAFIFGASFFQPLMLYPSILLTVYFIIGTFSALLDPTAHGAHTDIRPPMRRQSSRMPLQALSVERAE